MIEAKLQRATHLQGRGSRPLRGWRVPRLLPAVLLAAFASAGAQQAGNPPATDPPAQAAQTRGIAAQAATDATAAQLPADPQAASVPSSSAPDVDAARAPDEGTSATPAGMRGVLFRVTPPQAALLPAETAQMDDASRAPRAAAADGSTGGMPPAPVLPATVAPSYLLATIHFGTPEEQGIDYAAIERTLAGVESFVNEANLDEAWKPDYDAFRWLPVERPLSAMIGKEGFAKARALLPAVRAQDLDRMKPWSVLALLEARGETGGDATMDARLQRLAAASGKRVLHLESLEEQLRALDCVPAEEHARVLDERLRASWILRIESARAMAWYRARNLDAWLADIDRMDGLSDEAKAIEHRARLCLLEQRNARWIGQLQTLFQDGPCLVAVGAVHLVGSDGLLAALRRDGYTVEAMPL